jgi:hypothetical protein
VTAAFYKDLALSIKASSKCKIVSKFFHRLGSNYLLLDLDLDGKMWFGKVKAKQTMTVTNCYIDYLFYGCTAGNRFNMNTRKNHLALRGADFTVIKAAYSFFVKSVFLTGL